MDKDQKRIEDCRRLYIKYGGRQHELIEKEMRELGHADFHRRSMYRRFERGRCLSGWIDKLGWRELLSVPPAVAGGLSQTSTGLEINGDDEYPQDGSNAQPQPPATARGTVPARRKYNHGKHRRLAKLKARRRRAVQCANFSLSSSIPQNEEQAKVCTLNKEQAKACTPNAPTDDFHAWLKTQPGMWNWDWRHQLYIYEHLKRVTDGTCKRLMIFLPPRHGKSELVTVRYSAWRLQRDPSLNVILGSYNQRLANRFSRKVRRVIADAMSVPPAAAGGLSQKSAQMEKNDDQYAHQAHIASPNRSNTLLQPPAAAGGTDPATQSPFPFARQRPANSVAEWETTMGGGLRAVGVGGGVTGFGASLIVIDDPVKSRAEAESAKIREKVWDWFNDDLYTRLEPNGAIILIQTRWHEDDLAGRLLREMEDGGEQWEVISLPAIAESEMENVKRKMESAESVLSSKGTKIIAEGEAEGRNPGYQPENDSDPEGVEQTAGDVAPLQGGEVIRPFPGVTLAPLAHPRLLSLSPSATGTPHSKSEVVLDEIDRRPGEALCPERFNIDALENLRRKLGTYSFSALYQQRPTPAEGMIFKREWFKNIVKQTPPGLRWCRGYDLAVSTKTTADYTASFRVAYDSEGNLYIDGGFRKRIEFPEQRRYILGRIAAELDTEHGIELALHGQGIMQDLRRQARLQGRRFRGVPVTGDKLTRALRWSSLAEEGKVVLVRAGWNADFLDEACAFPGGQFDDQVDAVSIAVKMFEKVGGRLIRF